MEMLLWYLCALATRLRLIFVLFLLGVGGWNRCLLAAQVTKLGLSKYTEHLLLTQTVDQEGFLPSLLRQTDSKMVVAQAALLLAVWLAAKHLGKLPLQKQWMSCRQRPTAVEGWSCSVPQGAKISPYFPTWPQPASRYGGPCSHTIITKHLPLLLAILSHLGELICLPPTQVIKANLTHAKNFHPPQTSSALPSPASPIQFIQFLIRCTFDIFSIFWHLHFGFLDFSFSWWLFLYLLHTFLML